MSELTFSKRFRSGAGVGDGDLAPYAIRIDQTRAEFTPVEAEMFLSTGILSGDLTDYEQVTELYLQPGYFYIGDRELYAFGAKATQITHPVVDSDGETVLKLVDFPDGKSPAAVLAALDMYGSFGSAYDGAAPILVSCFPSGTLEGLGAPLDKLISSETGLSGVMGYIEYPDESGNPLVRSGECPDWPALFSPLSRYAVCYEEWRSGEILAPDTYTYQFDQNRIVLPVGTSLSGEYCVEFESMNEPFPVSLNLDPLVHFPEDVMICLSPSGEVEPEEPGLLFLHRSRSRSRGDRSAVFAEVFSEDDNRLTNQGMAIKVGRMLLIDDSEEYYSSASGLIIPLSGQPAYDLFPCPSGEVFEGRLRVSDAQRIAGMLCIESVGGVRTLSGSGDLLGEYTGQTGPAGFLGAEHIAPSVVRYSHDALFQGICGSLSGTTRISLISEETEAYYEIPEESLSGMLIVEPVASGLLAGASHIWGEIAFLETDRVFPVPSGVICPSSLRVRRMEEEALRLLTGADPTDYPVSGLMVLSGGLELGAVFLEVPEDEGYLMFYSERPLATRLDGRVRYGE